MSFGSNISIEWLSLSVSTISACATVLLAILVLRWTKKSEQNEVTRSIQTDWRDYNLTILADEDLQRIEAQNHLFDDLTNADIKKMCLYFIKVNVPYNMWIANKNHILSSDQVDREVSNQARLLFRDREFIEKHVFPRGYEHDFCEQFRVKWQALDLPGDGKA